MKHETEEELNIPFGTKLAIWGRYTTVAITLTLAGLGAVQVKQNLHWGSQAIAQEQPKEKVVADLAIPKEMPEAIDVPSDGKARCLGNAKNDSQKAHCHELFAKKSNAQFSEVY